MAREDVNIKVSANVAEAIRLWKAMQEGPQQMARELDGLADHLTRFEWDIVDRADSQHDIAEEMVLTIEEQAVGDLGCTSSHGGLEVAPHILG